MGPNALNSVYTYYHYLLPTLAAGLFLSWYSLTELERPVCRCRPWEPCWPTEKLWSGLNTSIGGNLVRLKPVGYVCSGPTFDQGACGGLRLLNRNSSWRASNPGNFVFKVVWIEYQTADNTLTRNSTRLGMGKWFIAE
jgi:hypothetical protein